MEKDNTVRCAGGFIIQMMPFATEETISRIEENLKNVSSVTSILDQGKTPEELLEILLGNVGWRSRIPLIRSFTVTVRKRE